MAEDAFWAEEKVVLQEIRRAKDQVGVLYDLFVQALWQRLELRNPVLGTLKGLQDLELTSVRAFHQQRASRILETLGDGPLTVYQITLELFPRLDPMNRFLAVSEVVGHLDLLQARRDVTSTKKGPVRLWRATRGPVRERDAIASRPQ